MAALTVAASRVKQQKAMPLRDREIVAPIAGERSVSALEWKRRSPVVEGLERERLLAVALLAVGGANPFAVLPPGLLVHVVVAGDAEIRDRFVADGEAGTGREGRPLE
jgi:hypothetical protein